MARGKATELRAVRGGRDGPSRRAAYYEDYAKPVIVNWPFVLVAAAALFVVGHFANRGAGVYAKPWIVNWAFMIVAFVLVAAAALFAVGHFANRGAGWRLGGQHKKENGKHKKGSPANEDSGNRSSSSINGSGDEIGGRRGNQPMSLAELRALRAEAAEARLKHGTTTNSGPGAVKPTPLGSILLLAKKVDKLEEETSQFLVQVKDNDSMDSKEEKEHSRLLELLTQVQLEIDGVQKSDESVRPHRKTETNRVQKLILALEGIEKGSRLQGGDFTSPSFGH